MQSPSRNALATAVERTQREANPKGSWQIAPGSLKEIYYRHSLLFLFSVQGKHNSESPSEKNNEFTCIRISIINYNNWFMYFLEPLILKSTFKSNLFILLILFLDNRAKLKRRFFKNSLQACCSLVMIFMENVSVSQQDFWLIINKFLKLMKVKIENIIRDVRQRQR